MLVGPPESKPWLNYPLGRLSSLPAAPYICAGFKCLAEGVAGVLASKR